MTSPRKGIRFYRALLQTLPAAFRARHEQAMLQTFSNLSEATGGKSLPKIRLWLHIIADHFKTAGRAWTREFFRRKERRHGFWDALFSDSRLTLWMLRRNPSFTIIAVTTIALGIAGATIAFTVVNGTLLRPLPYDTPESLVALFQTESNGPRLSAAGLSSPQRNPTSPGNFLEWQRDAAEVLDVMTAATPWNPVMTGLDRPDRLNGLRATYGLFEMLGVPAAMGRTFTRADEGSPHILVLGHEMWQGVFGGDPQVVGLNVNLDGETYEVIGVMPAEFRFPPFWAVEAGMWVPLEWEPDAAAQRRAAFLRVFGRIKPGVSLEALEARMDAIASRLEEDYSWSNAGIGVRVEHLSEPGLSVVRPTITIVSGFVLILLLIACSNVANLLLSRGAARQTELAIRGALGASQSRIIRQWMTESLIVAVLGGAAGLGLTIALKGPVSVLVSDLLPVTSALDLDYRVFGFALGISVLAGVIFGIAPSFLASRQQVGAFLRGNHTTTGSGNRIKTGLVMVEIALAVSLLTGAGLLTKSFIQLTNHDPGFSRKGVVALDLSFGASANGQWEERLVTYRTISRKLESLPGVAAVGFVNHMPVGSDMWGVRYVVQSAPVPVPGSEPRATFRVADHGYAQAIGLTLLEGRWFDGSETSEDDPTLVINQTMANETWPGESAIDQTIRLGTDDDGPIGRVIGVYRDAGQGQLRSEVGAEFYHPVTQDPTTWNTDVTVVIAGVDLEAATLTAARESIWRLDSEVSLTNMRTIESVLHTETSRERTSMAIVGGLAFGALVLSAIGLYGVLSFIAAQRKREIGVRVALGASTGSILRSGLKRAMTLVIPGLAIGMVGSLAVGRFLESLLWQVAPADPATFGAVALVLGIVSLGATIIPMRRASKTDPAIILREE